MVGDEPGEPAHEEKGAHRRIGGRELEGTVTLDSENAETPKTR
jgi:hypothetical protein